MKTPLKVALITLVGGIVGFTLNGQGPLGSMIWPPADGMPEPAGANLALLMVEGVLEAVAFGLGIAFLVVGYPWLQRANVGRAVTAGAYVGIAWLLMNWVPHTAMHINHGNILVPADFAGLVVIEYMFHVTLMAAGAVLALFFVRALQARSGTPVASSARTPAKAVRA